MCLSCNTPAFLWDEFFATAAYLTNLTAATANKGHTPYELWFDRTPSLSHLQEIRCRALSLQLPVPSKIYACSTPCILIGYTPHSKAYCLWEPSTSRIFNSFHVTFTEHLNAQPSPLLPGKTLGTENAACPPSWESPGAPLPPNPPLPSNHPFSHPSNFDLSLPPSDHKTLSAKIPYMSITCSSLPPSVLPARLGLKAYHSSWLSEARGLDCFQPETEPQAICVCS
jgi:hypothetical protein